MLLDYVDIVVHVQHSEERVFYALERLWKDCPEIELPEDAVGHPRQGARSTPQLTRPSDEDGDLR